MLVVRDGGIGVRVYYYLGMSYNRDSPPFDAKNHLTLAKKIVAGKFERIPNVYSDDLFQAIRWMLHRQRSKRPRVEDLEKIPKLSALLGHNTINTSMNDKQSYLSKLQELKLYEQKLDKRASELSLRETNATGTKT